MGVYMINVYTNTVGEIHSFDLYNTDTKESIKVTKEQLYAAIELGRIKIENIQASNNRLSGRHGEIARYRTINDNQFTGIQYVNDRAVIIIGEDKENKLYKVITANTLKETILTTEELKDKYYTWDRYSNISNLKNKQISYTGELINTKYEQFVYSDIHEVERYKKKAQMLDADKLIIKTYDSQRITAEMQDKYKDSQSDIVIPKGVTEIASDAFKGGKYGRVVLPETIKKISRRAFQRTNIKELELIITDDMNIERRVFNDCKVDKLIVQTSLETLPDNILEGIHIQDKLILPECVKDIGAGQLIGFSSNDVSYIDIKDIRENTLRLLGKDQVKINKNIETIDYNGIQIKNEVSVFEVPNNIKHIKPYAINGKFGKLIINHSLIVDDSAFFNSRINELYINAPLEYVGKMAFYSCFFNKVVINSKINKIGGDAFNNDAKETKYKLEINELPDEIGDSAFSNAYIDSLVINKDIGVKGEVFINCNINKLYIDYTINHYYIPIVQGCNINMLVMKSDETLGDWMVEGCKIKALKLIGDMRDISGLTFSDCGIQQLILPENIEKIHERAFSGNNLTQVKFPDSLKFIGISAFAFNKLTELTLKNDDIVICNGAFLGNKFIKANIAKWECVEELAFEDYVELIRT